LSGVHGDKGAVLVGKARDLADGRHDAGDVRGPRDGHQPEIARVLADLAAQVLHVQRAVGGVDPDVFHAAAPLAPGKHVRVVFHERAKDGLASRHAEAHGQLVEGVRGVLHEDEGVVVEVRPDEPGHDLPASLVDVGREEGLEARAAVHAAVVLEEARKAVQHRREGGRGGRVVQVHIGHLGPIHQGRAPGDAGYEPAHVVDADGPAFLLASAAELRARVLCWHRLCLSRDGWTRATAQAGLERLSARYLSASLRWMSFLYCPHMQTGMVFTSPVSGSS